VGRSIRVDEQGLRRLFDRGLEQLSLLRTQVAAAREKDRDEDAEDLRAVAAEQQEAAEDERVGADHHCRFSCERPRSRWIDGSATFTSSLLSSSCDVLMTTNEKG